MPDNELKILVRYHADIPKIGKIDVGDWIDLYAAENAHHEKGEWKLISLGVGKSPPSSVKMSFSSSGNSPLTSVSILEIF